VHSSADQTRFERVQMPVDQRILMMKVVKLFRAASRGCAVARMALVTQLTDQLGAFGLAPHLHDAAEQDRTAVPSHRGNARRLAAIAPSAAR